MADRFPLIVDSTTQTIKELPSGDNLDLTGSSIVNASSIDVTGTVTADGLTVDGNPLIQGAQPYITLTDSVWTTGAILRSGVNTLGTAIGDYFLINAPSGKGVSISTNNSNNLATFANTGDISFYDSAGTTAKLFWDASAEYLGIGTSTPTNPLNVVVPDNSGIQIESGAGEKGYLFFGDDASNTVGRIGYDHATDAMDFWTDSLERMRIDASGNVGIGCTPEDWDPAFDVLRVGKTASLFSYDTAGDGLWLGSNAFYDDTLNDYKYITTDPASLYIQLNGTHSWSYAASGTADTQVTFSEAMRIDASGNLLVGLSSISANPDQGYGVAISGSGSYGNIKTVGNGSHTHFTVVNATNVVGSITSSASATAYNTSSDQRLKENIVDAPSASDDIDAIQVRSFDWKADGSHQKYGMVAQELQSVAPEAVSGDADSDEMMGVDYSKLVPMMLKEIQSLRARVSELESK
jgi:hypothetical protein